MLCLAIVLGAAPRADPLVLEGRVEVVDNATIEIWGQRIRLSGITAPAPDSEGGKRGKRYLEELLAGVHVRCEVAGPALHFALQGRCVAASVDIAEQLVQLGFARHTGR